MFRLRRLLPPVAIYVAIYVAILAVTRAAYFGDTVGYAQNILAFDRDRTAGLKDFWDFGHLLWRPLGWLLFRAFGGWFSYTKTGESNLTVVALLIAVSILSGLIAFLLVQALATRFLDRGWAAGFVAVAFVCFHGFLNYVQTGSSYIAGLMWLTLALWLAVRGTEDDRRARAYSILSGAAAALSVLFWLPYIVAVPGVLAVFVVRRRIGLAAVTLASAAVLTCAGYAVALVALDIHTFTALREWATASGHGSAQTRRLLRMASGLPRSFLWIGDEGALIKRYLLHDPYTHVTLSEIVLEQFWRLVVFYAAAGAMLWVLLRASGGRLVLWILAAAAVPVLLFAVLVFEPGSIERYLPLYPFLCLAVAFCLSCYRQHRVAVAGVVVFLSIAILLNVAALSRSSVLAHHRPTRERALSLENKVGPQGLVALLSLADDLYQLAVSFPFDPAVRRTSLPVYDVVQVSNARVLTWRREFAQKALHSLDQGQAVWVSKRLLAERPEPSWGWTEGDDPNVSWKDLRPFFSRLNYSEDVGGSDGFLRLAASDENKAFLSEAASTGRVADLSRPDSNGPLAEVALQRQERLLQEAARQHRQSVGSSEYHNRPQHQL